MRKLNGRLTFEHRVVLRAFAVHPMAASKIQAPKGTLDTLPADAGKWQTIERIAREVRDFAAGFPLPGASLTIRPHNQ